MDFYAVSVSANTPEGEYDAATKYTGEDAEADAKEACNGLAETRAASAHHVVSAEDFEKFYGEAAVKARTDAGEEGNDNG